MSVGRYTLLRRRRRRMRRSSRRRRRGERCRGGGDRVHTTETVFRTVSLHRLAL
jgi:hypothetical protein